MNRQLFKLICLTVTALASVNAYTLTDKSFFWAPGSTMWYLEYLPPTYSPTATGSAKSPVIIFLHGAGENGSGQESDLVKLKSASGSIPYYINNSQWNVSLPFIVLAPQTWGWWDEPKVTPLAQQIATLYPGADTTRIYLTGLSQGGAGVWDSIRKTKAKTDLYAAAVPICGAQNYVDSTDWQAPVQSGIPIWAFHNSNDPTVGVGNTENWIAGLNGHGICPTALKTIFTASTHDAWTAVYKPTSTINIYAWFLQFTNQRPLSSCVTSTTSTTASSTASTTSPSTTVAATTSTTSTTVSSTTTSPSTTVAATSTTGTTTASTTSTSTTAAPTTTTTTTTSTTGTPTYGTWQQKFLSNFGFWEYKPSFVPSGGKYPLLVFLHGSDAASNGAVNSVELNKVLVSSIPKFINNGQWNPAYPFLVLAPQSDLTYANNSYMWETADTVLTSLLANYSSIIDTTRIYITGQGRGASGISTLSVTNINKLAAAHYVRIYSDASAVLGSRMVSTNLPTWFYTNQDDPNVAVSYTNNWVTYLTTTNPITPAVRSTVNPTGGLNSLVTAYDPSNPTATNLYNWFLTYTN
ncbi:hypothetical protein DLAC_10969 [Tieghemostelium lacteum]|uniref:Phospholipase/carboxylesterase/thioesterase domain-containing protein n=1 Tax=Tieghemostelium lacteum TaxID=361077 RepID=A0A151Z2V5_TIELA|nr:hypothetical protein DLAC_10969 [Tieghemostelium lacteum]|eukprot:KYQ88278.1 hypothetical protein DLAC_10969 [Tieghemostelium lacteum]